MSNWSVLQEIGREKWPGLIKGKMLRAFGKGYEIELWKELLPIKWEIYSTDDPPRFSSNLDWVKMMEKKHPNRWFETKQVDKGDGPVWEVKEHWLGSGMHPFYHSQPENELTERIWSLGVSREKLFTEWGLRRRQWHNVWGDLPWY